MVAEMLCLFNAAFVPRELQRKFNLFLNRKFYSPNRGVLIQRTTLILTAQRNLYIYIYIYIYIAHTVVLHEVASDALLPKNFILPSIVMPDCSYYEGILI